MKKLIMTGLVALGIVSMATAELTFENKLYSDDTMFARVNKHSETYLKGTAFWDDEKENYTDFPGIKERMKAEYTSEKVDLMGLVRFRLDDKDGKHYKFFCDQTNIYDLDYYIALRPIADLELSMHKSIYTAGSYLPIYDDNVSAGNLGSTGFTVAYKPSVIPGLTLAGTLPMENWVNGDKDCGNGDDEDEELNIGVGVDYNYKDLLTIGATVQDMIDGDEWDNSDDQGRTFGLYATLNVIKHFTIGGGLSLYEGLGCVGGLDWTGLEAINITGDNISNIEATLDLGNFFVCAEGVWTFDQKNDSDPYDFYTAASLTFSIKQFAATVTGMLFLDLNSHGDELDPATTGEFLLAYTIGRHELSVGLDVERAKDLGIELAVGIPVAWKYSF